MSTRRITTLVIRISLLTSLTILSTPALAAVSNDEVPMTAGPPDPRFGAIETYDAPGAATEMGAGWTRIPFLWAQIQPSGSHEWLPPISDEALALEIAQGRQPVGLIISTPGWATDTGIGPGVPYGLHTGHNDPSNLWASFVRALITTYTGRIDHWIIWNEPDVWDPGHPGYTWGGSVEDFFQLQRVAYLTIKEANPNAVVVFSGTSYWWDVSFGRDLFFRRYLDTLIQDLSAPANNYYCDAIALHVYFQPDFVYSITALYHQLMREHGFDKPIWIVETNAAPSLDPQMPAPNGQFAITLDEQAAYITQAFAMGIAGGATRIGVFKMIDTPSDLAANPEPFGIVRADGSRRPAFIAYRVATTYLAGFQSGQLEQRPEVSIVTVARASGTTTVLWTRTPSPVTVQIPARTASATLVDMWGNQRAVAATGGVYTVPLPGASCTHGSPCIIGGSPYLIVEGKADVVPPPLPSKVQQDTGIEPGSDDAQEAVHIQPTPTPLPEYTVNLRPAAIKGARDAWRKHALPGYEIEISTGSPFRRYLLTIVNNIVIEAWRSLESLKPDQKELNATRGESWLSISTNTLRDQRALGRYTITGLFERVERYYEGRPTSPACDTQVTVQLDRDWAFPRRIVERLADDCEAVGAPAWITVVAFATLTPTPTRKPETPTATASPTPSSTPTATALPTATATWPSSPTPSTSPTPLPPEPASSSNTSFWLVIFAGVVAVGAFLFRRNGKSAKRKT